MRVRFLPFAVGFLAILVSASLSAQTASKKLISAGWDMPNTQRLRDNLALMEKQAFDGVMVQIDGVDDEGKKVSLNQAFSGRAMKLEWFAQAVDELVEVDKKATKLRHNFLFTGPNPGNVDWFDDAGWQNIIQHYRVAATVARDGHLQGILFDPEPYHKEYRPFSYPSLENLEQHSYADYVEKARQRGREMIAAIAEVKSDLTIFTYFMNSIHRAILDESELRIFRSLEDSKYGLFSAFIDGWLDVAPPQMILVDGAEFAYMANSEMDFLRISELIRHKSLRFVAPENRARYRAQVQVGYGLYLDGVAGLSKWKNYHLDTGARTAVQNLAKNTSDALRLADEYVWIYGEKYRWWPTPNGGVREDPWEHILPGVTNALLGAVDPSALAHRLLEQQETEGVTGPKNLLENGDFALASESSPAPLGWNVWQSEESSGTLSRDTETVYPEHMASAKLSGVALGCFTQSFDVQEHSQYVVRVALRERGRGEGYVRVRWHTPDQEWIAKELDTVLYPTRTDKDGWQWIEGLFTAPEGAGRLVLLLNAKGQETEEDVIHYAEAQVFKAY